MQNTIKYLGRNTAIYFVGATLSRSLAFFLLPLYTKYINPIDYGYFDLSCAYLSLISSVIFFEIHNGILRYILKSTEIQDKYAYITNGLIVYLFSLIIYTCIALCISHVYDIKNIGAIYLMGLLDNLVAIILTSTRGLSQTVKYALAGIVGAASVATLNIIMILLLGLGYKSLYYAQIASAVLQIVFIQFSTGFFGHLRISHIEKQKIKQLLIWAIPLSINSFAYWGMTGYNKIAVERYLGLDFNGIYAIVTKFSTILNLIISCFLLAWQEIAFTEGKGERLFYYKAINSYIYLIGIGVVVFIPLIAIIFPIFVNIQYHIAKIYIPLALLGVAVSSISSFLGSIYGALEKTKFIIYTTIIGCITNIIFSNILIKHYGLNGANISLILAFAVCIISRIFILKRHIEISIKAKTLIISIPLIILSYCLFVNFSTTTNIAYLIILAVIITIYNRKLLFDLYAKFRSNQ